MTAKPSVWLALRRAAAKGWLGTVPTPSSLSCIGTVNASSGTLHITGAVSSGRTSEKNVPHAA